MPTKIIQIYSLNGIHKHNINAHSVQYHQLMISLIRIEGYIEMKYKKKTKMFKIKIRK